MINKLLLGASLPHTQVYFILAQTVFPPQIFNLGSLPRYTNVHPSMSGDFSIS